MAIEINFDCGSINIDPCGRDQVRVEAQNVDAYDVENIFESIQDYIDHEKIMSILDADEVKSFFNLVEIEGE